MHFAERKTPGGYLCGEVASALQKEIRRCNDEQALFWATELELGGFVQYVWGRLLIIASEDVGLADSNVMVQLIALRTAWELEWKKERKNKRPAGSSREFLVHAVLLLARAPKNRIVDHAAVVMYDGDRGKPEIPDYALDTHTAAGRALGRRNLHFYAEAGKVENKAELPDPFEDRAVAIDTAGETS